MATEPISNDCPFYKGRKCPGVACEIEKDCVIRLEQGEPSLKELWAEVWAYVGVIVFYGVALVRHFWR